MTFSANGVPLQNLFLQSYDTVDQYVGNTALACGLNTAGQLGIGNITTVSSFTQLGGSNNWSSINFGASTGLALKNDGTLWSWGSNSGGVLGINASGNTSSPVAVLASNIKSFTISNTSALAIRTDGTLLVWGSNAFGQLGNGNTNNVSSPSALSSAVGWKQVSTFANAVAAIKNDGTLWTWGFNASGQLGVGDTNNRSIPTQVGNLTNWAQVSCGGGYMMAIKTDGSLWAWGSNSAGNHGNGTITSTNSPVQVGAVNSNWRSINCFVDRSYGIRIDNTLWAWGNNSSGMLGVGDTTNKSTPVQVGSSTSWKQIQSSNIAAASAHTMAVTTDGRLFGWGNNQQGQLGLGTTATGFSAPIQIGVLTNWKQVTTGQQTTGAVTYSDDYQL